MFNMVVRNVNHAYWNIWWQFKVNGVRRESRNGPVVRLPGPFMTAYQNPRERVLFDAERDANPVFHLMECIWMMAGSMDVKWLSQFNARMVEYSDGGLIMGAYGARWAEENQLQRIVDELREKPHSRQCVLQMWDVKRDLGSPFKDRPCNTHVYFEIDDGKLNMTVCCRSNDALWGAYGANAVHFSFLQEVMASSIGVPVGTYYQFSNNLHAYLNVPIVEKLVDSPPYAGVDPYSAGTVTLIPILEPGDTLQELIEDCQDMLSDIDPYRTRFVTKVAHPLMEAYLLRKAGQPYDIDLIPDCDWKKAFIEWIERREAK